MVNSPIPTKCPSCGQEMRVCSLRCSVCATEVQGEFPLGRFAQLSGEQLTFLETFIRCRGSLKDLGAALGISYPTARNRLDDLIEAMDFDDRRSASAHRMDVLTRLKEGQITVEEAMLELQKEKGAQR
ncbi:MAG: DUF2089 domain-containing protein [Oscillospiraceae bacterium]